MAEALKDVYLGENNLEKMRKASKGSAQTLKMKDGNLKMDSFTASAIMQIYDKINDKNKKTFEKMMKDGKRADIMKLQKFAMSKISSEYVPEEFEEEFELDEAKASGGYDLYHNDFSSAMQHAYAHAKKKGFTVDPEEIDNKVATGPRKPSKGKTNRYILGTDKKKNLHVQVANLDNKRFELNMYIEETEMDEASKEVKDRVKMFKKIRDKKSSQGFQPTGLKNEKKLDPVGQADADIDNDGDVDSSDKYLKNRRKKISKAIKNDESKLYSHVKSMMKKEYANIKKMKKK